MYLPLLLAYFVVRIDLQSRVRQLEKVPREADWAEVERLRHLLLAQFQILLALQSQTIPAIQVENLPVVNLLPDDFDNLDENLPTESQSSVMQNKLASAFMSDVRPENRRIPLPRACFNQGHPLRNVELSLRMRHAGHYLNALREMIVEKSFHYSHVIRVAPNKGVRTRARALIVKLNQRIALYCWMYSRCRSEMVHLDIDQDSLSKFQILRKEDVSASTAIMKPNEPGVSSHRLSWIWKTGSDSSSSPEALKECEYIVDSYIFS